MIVKVGGSVAEKIPEIVQALKDTNSIIVPGGWKFAELIRKLRVSDEYSHWMAIAAMNIYGYYISDHGIPLVEPETFDDLIKCKRPAVVLPYILLRKHDELPHSWDVTSDSISIWLAVKLGEKVVKVTASGGLIFNGKIVDRIEASKLVGRETVIDRYAPTLLKNHGIELFVCGVRELKKYILSGRAIGTLIEGR